MQNPNEDTEWNDILRKKGIIPEKTPGWLNKFVNIHWNPSIVDPSIVENLSLIDKLGLTKGFFTT